MGEARGQPLFLIVMSKEYFTEPRRTGDERKAFGSKGRRHDVFENYNFHLVLLLSPPRRYRRDDDFPRN